MSQTEPTLHEDSHVDSNYEHVTLATDRALVTFHRNRDELATFMYDNITAFGDSDVDDDLIDEILVTAQDRVAPVVKYNTPIESALRWGCTECGETFDDSDDRTGTPPTCPDGHGMLVREGSSFWLSADELPKQRLFR